MGTGLLGHNMSLWGVGVGEVLLTMNVLKSTQL